MIIHIAIKLKEFFIHRHRLMRLGSLNPHIHFKFEIPFNPEISAHVVGKLFGFHGY